MSWPSFLSPASAVLGLLAIPLVAFYFLKLRRPVVLVPSTALWRAVLDDQRVNSPFQRFKRHLLLWLQLLALLLLVLAATQPISREADRRVLRRPVFIDCSASMAALDAAGGSSRLDAAKREVLRLIDELSGGQQLCLVSFGRHARSHCGFSDDKRLLREALAGVAVDEVESDLDEAMRFAQALARSAAFEEVLLYSDGNLPERIRLDLAFGLRYQLVPPAGTNGGITALGASRQRDGGWEAFAELSGSAGLTGALTLRDERDMELGREAVDLGADGQQRLLIRLPEDASGTLELRFEPSGFDALAADNRAFLELPLPRPLRVRLSPELAAFRHALSALPELEIDPPGEGADDVIITRHVADLDRPARVLLSVGVVPPALSGLVALGQGADEVADWDRRTELLQHVLLSEVVLTDQPRWSGEAREAELEALGYEVLIHGTKGPLAVARRGPRPSYHLLFDPERSTLVYRVAFPILVHNLVLQARRLAGLAEARGRSTGIVPALDLAPDRDYQLHGPPPLAVQERRSGEDGQLLGVILPRVGRYQLRDGATMVRELGAGLLSPSETRLERVERLQFKETLAVEASAGAVATDLPLWSWLATLALLALLVEWWVFHGGLARA